MHIELGKTEDGQAIKLSIPLLMRGGLFVQASSGSGKSWVIRRIIEQSFGKVPIHIFDYENDFETLREKFPFLRVKDKGEIGISVKTAGILAERLVSIKASSIIDLYDLQLHERLEFVQRFLSALMNLRRSAWSAALLILDEAQIYAPEQGEAVSKKEVIDVCTRGRKRGIRAILATPRISSVSKDAVAQLKSKLIGHCGLDIDVKRAGEELGFFNKEQRLELRRLKTGEFFAYGLAISQEVKKIKIGDVETTHLDPEKGMRRGKIIIPTPEKIKKLLEHFKDLPKEAEERQRTIDDYKKKVAELTTELRKAKAVKPVVQAPVKIDPKEVARLAEGMARKAIEEHHAEYARKIEEWAKKIRETLLDQQNRFTESGALLRKALTGIPELKPKALVIKSELSKTEIVKKETFQQKLGSMPEPPQHTTSGGEHIEYDKLPDGERATFSVIAKHDETGIDRKAVRIITGYANSSNNTYLSKLIVKGLITERGGKFHLTGTGVSIVPVGFEVVPTTAEELREYWLSNLPDGEKKILGLLLANTQGLTRDQICETTGYAKSSTNTYISKLSVKGLVDVSGKTVVPTKKLTDDD